MVLVDFPPDQFTGADQKGKLFFVSMCAHISSPSAGSGSPTYLQVCVQDPDEGADRRINAGLEDHKPSWTVFSPEAAVSRGRRLQTETTAALLEDWKCALT